ncbi:hypothetical protein LTR56_010599 [Elasticomyces elasticus]|nr:hypothetical protein LTR56_010599 [Elasticomyces elasticus]KAK3648662.1 hypothetical protein LTR22_013298 [Elasticomyces elasticus]KAK4932455.1 hypothetical protein LTR49_001324 [Elasticomyces elasticus]KAK5760156.1 hypothetical protein LTS12_009711 [Elasticomyces elasticus]
MVRTRGQTKKADDPDVETATVVDDKPKPKPKANSKSKVPNEDAVPEESETNNKVKHFTVPYHDKTVPCERRGEGDSPALIWTHGAGGGLAAPATSQFADGFSEHSPIVSFQGSMNLPSRTKIFHTVMEHQDFDLALGGRSMGARAATIAAVEQDRKTKALVLVSFPLVGGKKGESREQILLDLPDTIDVLFISGDRDSMCDLEQLREVIERMRAKCWLVTVKGADHGMSWSPAGTVATMRQKTGAIAAEWLQKHSSDERYYELSWVRDGSAGDLVSTGWLASLPEASEITNGDEPQDVQGADVAEDDELPPAKKRKRGKT